MYIYYRSYIFQYDILYIYIYIVYIYIYIYIHTNPQVSHKIASMRSYTFKNIYICIHMIGWR